MGAALLDAAERLAKLLHGMTALQPFCAVKWPVGAFPELNLSQPLTQVHALDNSWKLQENVSS